MVKEIRIYVEGGGNGKATKSVFHEGMSRFLSDLREGAKKKQINFRIIVCGSRSSAFRDFCNGNKSNPTATNILLVDSESAVTATTCSEHLVEQDGWNLKGIRNNCVHLMAQVMESWLIADVDTLENYYGKGFKRSSIPGSSDIEIVSKSDVERSLNNAVKSTTKGRYHKIRHGPEILGQLNVTMVRGKAKHCDNLFNFIDDLINPKSKAAP